MTGCQDCFETRGSKSILLLSSKGAQFCSEKQSRVRDFKNTSEFIMNPRHL